MSGKAPTLQELLASNPAAKDFVESFCHAEHGFLRCSLRRDHRGDHHDAYHDIEWRGSPQ